MTALALAASLRGQPAGQQTFAACAACHGLDGRGGEHAPNIATEQRVQQMPDEAILNIVKKGIPSAGMPGFSALLKDSQIREVVQYLRTLQGVGLGTKLPGDAGNGRKLFFGRAKCGECHMVNGRGGFAGPELTAYGGHSAAEVREAITDPDKNLNPRHGTVTVTLRDARIYRGIIRNEDNFSLQMVSLDGGLHLFDKADLTALRREPHSLMPGDYGTKLSASELDDLIKFLNSGVGGKKPDEDDEQ